MSKLVVFQTLDINKLLKTDCLLCIFLVLDINIILRREEREKMENIKNLKVYQGMLIVVDMVNGFVTQGDLHDEQIGKVVERQLELIKEAKEKDNLIIFIKDTHEENSTEHKRFQGAKHCIRGTKEEELIPTFVPLEKERDTISIEKNSTSFMEAPKFRKLIEEATNINEVDVVGCCSDICVVNGTMGLANYMDQWNRDVTIRVHEDAIATFAEEARQNYVEAAKLLATQQGIQYVKKR